MFQNTCKSFLPMIMPIVIAWRTRRGKINYGIGAGMIINDEGWIVTAGHILEQMVDLYNQVQTSKQKGRKQTQNQVTDYAAIIGKTPANLKNITIEKNLDVGVGQIDKYTPEPCQTYPRFRVRKVEQGELLCRLGYPFVNNIHPTWSANGGFVFSNLFPVPMFVNEALVSRFVEIGSGMWIETSSPGLSGQSGGPLADSDGLVCGIQVNTKHYPLEFQGAGRNQVLNVGRAAHVKSIRQILDTRSIPYLKEDI